ALRELSSGLFVECRIREAIGAPASDRYQQLKVRVFCFEFLQAGQLLSRFHRVAKKDFSLLIDIGKGIIDVGNFGCFYLPYISASTGIGYNTVRRIIIRLGILGIAFSLKYEQ